MAGSNGNLQPNGFVYQNEVSQKWNGSVLWAPQAYEYIVQSVFPGKQFWVGDGSCVSFYSRMDVWNKTTVRFTLYVYDTLYDFTHDDPLIYT